MKYNNEYEELFFDFDKENAFNELAELFFDRNFSTATKSEIELRMFHYYMKALINKYRDEETNVLDYSACSDYNIAKQLGITRERVRSLKVKTQARFPEEYTWTDSLISLKDNVRYDERKKRIIIPVPDPNLYNEIRDFIEKNGGYVEIQRSENVIQIRPEYYIMLIYDVEGADGKKKTCEAVMKELNKKNPKTPISIESKADMVNHILGIAENGFSILSSLMDLNNPLSITIKGLKSIFLRLENS